MTDNELEILARQVDELAEYAEVMRVQITGLLALLAREGVAAKLGIKEWELTRLQDPSPRQVNRWKHGSAREREARTVERESEIDQLLREARYRRDVRTREEAAQSSPQRP